MNTDNSKYHTIFDVGFVIAGSDTRNTEVTKLGLLFDISTDPAELETYIKESTDFVSTLSEDPDGVYNFFAASETVYETDPTTGKETSKIVNIGLMQKQDVLKCTLKGFMLNLQLWKKELVHYNKAQVI